MSSSSSSSDPAAIMSNTTETNVATTSSSSTPLFFADATLDLSEAHDFCETPEPQRSTVSVGSQQASITAAAAEEEAAFMQQPSSALLEMPTLTTTTTTTTDTRATTTSPSSPLSSSLAVSAAAAAERAASVTTKPTSPISHSSKSNNNDNGNHWDTTTTTTTTTMNRITSSDIVHNQEQPQRHHRRRRRVRRPNRPRDVGWTVAWLLCVPTTLTIVVVTRNSANYDNAYTSAAAAQWSVLVCILLAYAVSALVLPRLLYRGNSSGAGAAGSSTTAAAGGGGPSSGGSIVWLLARWGCLPHHPAGIATRHVMTQCLLACTPLSVAIYGLSTAILLLPVVKVPWYYALVPLLLLSKSLVHMHKWRVQQLFFQAMVGMALDILLKSLKARGLRRMMSLLLGLQVCAVVWWKVALFHSLSVWSSSSSSSSSYSLLVVLAVLVVGQWMTSTIIAILSHLASGGVANWCWQQSVLLQQHYSRLEQEGQAAAAAAPTTTTTEQQSVTSSDDASADYNVGYRPATFVMPEEYRTVDASVYQSVLDMDDDDMEEDFVNPQQQDDDDDRDGIVMTAGRRGQGQQARGGNGADEWTNGTSTTSSPCKTLVIAALTTSFGSIAQCGLLGGSAQIVWSWLRHANGLLFWLHRRRHRGAVAGFRGMSIGVGSQQQQSSLPQQQGDDNARGVVLKLFAKANAMARSFVRTHSDLAMCHVAAYYKSYQKASADVMVLVDASGVEPIIHDDITTQVCSNVCGSISGLIVIVVGTILSHRRSDNLTDEAFVQCMLFAFLFCYTLLFTVMEPLRASIKAIYVSFAEHPESLSQSFPLIFHRLSRISESNLA